MAYSKRGYLALGKETTAGTAVAPSVYLEFISETITTNKTLVFSNPVYGSRSKRLHVNRGINEAPSGEIVLEVEPNTIGYLLRSCFGAPSTSGPTDTTAYTHVFTQPYTTTALPTYTMDIAIGDDDSIRRYTGVKFNSVSFAIVDNVWQATFGVTAQYEFISTRFSADEATSQTSLSVYQTRGFTTSDTLNLGLGSANEEEKAISSITDAVTVVTAATAKDHSANDIITIKRGSPSFTQLNKFIFIGSQSVGTTFKIGAAIGSVAADCAENFTFNLTNDIEARHCASGVYNVNRYPAALLDKGYEASGTVTRYWADMDEQDKYDFSTLRAIEVETVGDLAGAATTRSSLKLQLPDVRWTKQPVGNSGQDDIVQEDLEFVTAYDATSSYEAKITLINKVSSY